MKIILVPTDFSANADNALYYAIDIARKLSAKIVVLNVYYVPYTNSYVSADFIVAEKKDLKAESEKQLKATEQKIKHSGKIDHELLSIEGFAVDEILKTINEKEIDLVVMGTKGADNFVDAVLGSNAAKVIEKAKCPVIAVPEDASFEGIEKITYATDYNNSDINAIEKLVELFRSFDAKINVLHIWDGSESHIIEKSVMESFKKKILEKIHYENLSFEMLKGGDLEISLEEYVDEGKTDLLVMSTQHRGFFDKLFGSSVTKHMAYHTSVPLMAFHYQNKTSEQIF